MTIDVSLEHVQTLANQLSPREKVRLIEYLSHQVASRMEEAAPHVAASSNRRSSGFARLRAELATLPTERLAGEQLERDRAERQASLEGVAHVHP